MRGPALADAATQLPWLSPGAHSLVALARAASPAVWTEIRRDPGALLLLLRFADRCAALPTALFDPQVLQGALPILDPPGSGFVDWQRSEVAIVYQSALAYAAQAERLARRLGRVDPDLAWSAGLLAPLGWLAVAAVAPEAISACLADADFPRKPVQVQQRLWGLEQTAIARRLASRWQLPAKLATLLGHLDLAPENAASLDLDLDLFRIVQLAVALVQQAEVPLQLPVGAGLTQNALALKLDSDELRGEAARLRAVVPLGPWEPPASLPLVRDLLHLAIEKRGWKTAPVLESLEREIDQLHRAVRDQRSSEEDRLQTLKLRALAELAAGAGHEINNPLAVISGQAQYLMQQEEDPARLQSLRKIVAQTQRIHEILTQLMQFARPPRPHWQSLNLTAVVREAAGSLTTEAAERQVELRTQTGDSELILDGDLKCIRKILVSLLRNAIAAAPTGGWAALRLDAHADHVDLLIEDNGPGPDHDQREHLFDPFYSGREAGRGRGLGLPTAWRLAGTLGGDIRFERLDNLTRFVFCLPRHNQTTLPRSRTNGEHLPGDLNPAALNGAD